MVLFTHGKLCVLLLAGLFSVTPAKSLNKTNQEETIEEIDEVFNEIEKNHHKLRTVFEDMLKARVDDNEEKSDSPTDKIGSPTEEAPAVLQRTSGEEECVCIPYTLCFPETGEQIRDGRLLLESRLNSYQCKDPNDVCCVQYPESKARMNAAPHSNCGYGYRSELTKQFPVDDPTLSNFGQYPWTVMINKGKGYSCVGSLIHPRVVLTAAHCANATEDFTVRAGEWNTNTKSEPFRHQNRKVTTVINHPKFRLDNLIYDVALLVTDEEFDLQENINTVCLTRSAPDPLVTHSDHCVATGWGVDKPDGRYNRIMKKLQFSLTDYQQCQQAFRSTRLGSKFELHQSFLCAYGLGGSDACQGNGGAPLVCCISTQQERYQQVGIVSWGIGCAEGSPSVFTKISQVRDWIDAVFDTLGYSKEYYTE